MVHTKAHNYAKNGNRQELEKEINRDINVIHEKDQVEIVLLYYYYYYYYYHHHHHRRMDIQFFILQLSEGN